MAENESNDVTEALERYRDILQQELDRVSSVVRLLLMPRTMTENDAQAKNDGKQELRIGDNQRLERLALWLALQNIKRNHLLTNDLFVLKGALTPKAKCQVQVNSEVVALGRREYVVLKSLAEEMLNAGTTGGDGYVSAEEIAERADKMVNLAAANNNREREPWWYPTYDDVRKVIKRLRGRTLALQRLIESEHGRGYRLSTHWTNIVLLEPSDPSL